MDRMLLPPGRDDLPYILEAFGGENVYIPTSAGTTRHLATSNETKGRLLVVGGGGGYSPMAVPFHYHNETRHDFLCLKGQMKVWLNDQCRVLNAGDYAHVAPKSKHSFQLIGDHTEQLGVVVPGGWENFFRSIGDVYDGPLWPDVDDQDPRKTLVPRIIAASEEYDVIPVQNHNRVEAQPFSERDHVLPGDGNSYFLRNGRGPSAVLGGTVVHPIARGMDTANTFSLGTIEGSYTYKTQALDGKFKFPTVPHFLFVHEGYLQVTVGGKDSRLGPTESVFLPDGTAFSIKIESRYAKVYVYSTPDGLIDLLYAAGKENSHTGLNCMIPESPAPWDKEKLVQLKGQFDFTLE